MSVPPDQLDRQAAYAAAVAPTGGAPGHPAVLPPPAPPAAPLPYPGYMSPQDLAAFALQTIQQAYQPQIDYLQQQQQQSQQMHAAQQAGLAQLYQILAGSMGGLGGQIGDIYNSAAQGLNLPSDAVTGDLGVSRDIVGSGALAGPGYGSAYPQLAGQQGQTEFLKAVQEGNAADQDITAQIQKLIAEQPAQVQQLLQQLTGQQADYAKAAQPTLEKVGDSLLQIDPTTGRVRVIYQGPAAAGKTTIRQLANGQLQAFDAAGRPVGKPYGPTKVVSSTHHYTATAGGDVLDTTTGEVVGRVRTSPSSAGKPYRFEATDGRTYELGPDGRARLVPGQPGPKSGSSSAPTAATIRAGWKTIADSYYHAPGSSKRLTDADIRRRLAAVNAARAAKDLPPLTPDMLSRMTPAQLKILGIAGSQRDPQDVYIDLVHSGIPARRAWGMVRKYYPEWGKDYFRGKGSAAATGGTPTSYRGVPQQQTALAQRYGSQYGVDPRLLLAIAGHETQWGAAGAGRQGYTLGYGVTDSGIISKYRGVANQYRWAAQTLAKWGVHTLADLLAGKAASYATDPNWEAGVARVYQSLGGSTV